MVLFRKEAAGGTRSNRSHIACVVVGVCFLFGKVGDLVERVINYLCLNRHSESDNERGDDFGRLPFCGSYWSCSCADSSDSSRDTHGPQHLPTDGQSKRLPFLGFDPAAVKCSSLCFVLSFLLLFGDIVNCYYDFLVLSGTNVMMVSLLSSSSLVVSPTVLLQFASQSYTLH